MARRRKIPRNKIQIRAFLRHSAENEVELIDRFRAHVHESAAAQRHSIRQHANGLPAEVQEFFADDLYELRVISDLADQLAIIALYRVVEINTGRILAHRFGAAARRNASDMRALRALLNRYGINIENIPHFTVANELRLLNNAIKHAGHVTDQLARKYPRWRRDRELAGLGVAYERLKRRVPSYIFRFAERVKLRFN